MGRLPTTSGKGAKPFPTGGNAGPYPVTSIHPHNIVIRIPVDIEIIRVDPDECRLFCCLDCQFLLAAVHGHAFDCQHILAVKRTLTGALGEGADFYGFAQFSGLLSALSTGVEFRSLDCQRGCPAAVGVLY